MGLELAKHYGITETLDSALYQVHRAPAALAHKAFGWSKYGMAEALSLVGYAALAGYISSAASIVMSRGTISIDTIDEAVMVGSALIVSSIGGRELYKNIRQGELAQARAEALDAQNLSEVVAFEEQLQRDRGVRHLGWYMASLPMWWGIMKLYSWMGSIDMTDPFVRGIIVCATVGTACIYGARYIFSSDIGSYSLKKTLNKSGDKNEK